MPSNLQNGVSAPSVAPPAGSLRIATAMRRVLARGYRAEDLRADILAGAVVGIVALPLSMALAIAVGAAPEHGLYTAVFAGAVVALLGGCKFQVTGPTAAFVVILAPILAEHGLSGLLTAGFLAGVILVAMGVARLGRLIQYIPHPVTTGFTTGIATVIATLQIKDVLGLRVASMPDRYVDKVAALWSARHTASLAEFLVGTATLALLLLVPRVIKRIPAPLIAIATVSVGAAIVHRLDPSIAVATIGSRFHSQVGGVEVAGIPRMLPSPSFPWGATGLSLSLVHKLFPAAFAIAMLGAIESLLSAVIADGLTGTKHDPDAELLALGVGNIVAPIFGGIAATGALARTATNIRTGARSPLASVVHALFVLLSIVLLAPLVAYVPMASLSGLLLLVAWNMSELRSFLGVVRIAPKSDVFVLLTCYGLTVLFDMVVAVSCGVVMAAILFMRRMADLTESRTLLDGAGESGELAMPKGVGIYEINGPLFFGASQKAMGALNAGHAGDGLKVMVLSLGKVPVIDSTGFVALENAVRSLLLRKKVVVLAGPLPRPATIWEKARLDQKFPGLHIARDLQSGVALAQSFVAARSSPAAPSVPAEPPTAPA
jgi:SulP family sulfate permease